MNAVAMPNVLSGVHLVQVESQAIPGAIEADDLLRIDFDQRTIRCDGFYAMRRGAWSGIMRFVRDLSGLQVEEGGKWKLVAGADLAAFEVLGCVRRVYRSAGVL